MLNITMEIYTIEKCISNGRKMELILYIWSKFKQTFEVKKREVIRARDKKLISWPEGE